jgi:hypothetical protein
VLRRIFGPRRDELTGELRKLHNEELHDWYYSPSIIRIIKVRRMTSLVVWTLDSFPAVYGTRRFNTEFTRALHLPLS